MGFKPIFVSFIASTLIRTSTLMDIYLPDIQTKFVYKKIFELIFQRCIASFNTYQIATKSILVNYGKSGLSEDRQPTFYQYTKTEFIGCKSFCWQSIVLVVTYKDIAEGLRQNLFKNANKLSRMEALSAISAIPFRSKENTIWEVSYILNG